MNTRNQTQIGRLLGWLPVPPAVVVFVITGLLVLPLVLMALTDDSAAIHQGLWRLAMAPALIGFILGVHAWLQARWRRAIDALRPLSRQPGVIDQPYLEFGLGAWAAVLLGAALAVWISLTLPVAGARFVYVLATNLVLFALMGLVIHDGLCRSGHLKRVVAAGLALDLFDRTPLMPMARFGQGVSLTFVGGISLSLLFQSAASLYTVQSLVIYSILIVASLTLFFSSIWSIHVALLAAQQRELAAVREQWGRARAALRRQQEQSGPGLGAEEAARLYHPLVVFGTFERQVLEASTWPFNPKIVKEVTASLVAPVLIYGIKVAMGLSGPG